MLGEFRRVKAAGGGGSERPVPELTDRETEILKYVATGMGYKEIATTLFLSHRTVQNHVQNIFGKLQMHTAWSSCVSRWSVASTSRNPT